MEEGFAVVCNLPRCLSNYVQQARAPYADANCRFSYMKITVDYESLGTRFFSEGKRSFGNNSEAEAFAVTLQRWDGVHGSINVNFKFDKPAVGRGANLDNVGWVCGATLSLSRAQARKLAARLLEYVESGRAKPTKLRFGVARTKKRH